MLEFYCHCEYKPSVAKFEKFFTALSIEHCCGRLLQKRFLKFRECFRLCYARKQLLLSARLSHRNSVCLSVRHTGGSVQNGAS